jgi:hypothetical protein
MIRKIEEWKNVFYQHPIRKTETKQGNGRMENETMERGKKGTGGHYETWAEHIEIAMRRLADYTDPST